MTIDFAAAPRTRIYTSWSTVVYFDAASGELRHGPIETSHENAVFVADPTSTGAYRQGWLMQVKCEKLEPLACGSLGCRTVSAGDPVDPPVAATLLELIPLERGLIAFGAEGHFLCAQPDGRVDLSKPWCSTWECFLASEDWCSAVPAIGDKQTENAPKSNIDSKGIAKFIVDPRLRMKVSSASKMTKLLIFGYLQWSHGRLFYDLSKTLHRRGYIVDIINWQVNHASYMGDLTAFYDFVLTSLDGVSILIDTYGVRCGQIIALSQHEMDMRILINQKGTEIFEKFAGYAVVGYQLFDASAIFGVLRHPLVVQHGVAFSEFYAEIPGRLTTVGYASSFSQKTIYGVEIKRGELAEASAREAGLAFKMAGSGSTANQMSFHDMPDFYSSVDAILITSVTEGAQLPVKEGAAAGRLVISTPVGDFPLRAYQGAGIIAPIEAEKYKRFTVDTLRYYKENPTAYADICRRIQNAARQFDWQYMISDWVELIESAKRCVLEQARSHQQAGRFAEAAQLFAQRADGGGDEEERWYARWQHARCLRDLKDEEGFVRTALQAFRERPHRAEPLHDLANYYLATKRSAPAAFYAEAAMAIPKPEQDELFVDEWLYEVGLRHSFSVAASWSDDAEQKERGRRVCDWLALSRDVPEHLRAPARYNSGWYAVSVQSLAPSLQFHPLSIAAPQGYHVANVSFCQYGDGFVVTARAVNYTLLPSGFHDKHGDISYRSRVLLLHLDHELRITAVTEVEPPRDLPMQSQETLGFEDPRPFVWRGGLWCVSCVRQINSEAREEMVLARINDEQSDGSALTEWRALPSGLPARREKNWTPQVFGEELRFVYSVDPTRIITEAGVVVRDEPATISAETFRGGSQAVPFDGGWLMLVHEAEVVNGPRRYLHRFVWLDENDVLRRLSRCFYLRQLGYEFVAGMAWHLIPERLVISFSVHDAEQFLAVVSADDIRAMLLDILEHERASSEVITGGRTVLDKLVEPTGSGLIPILGKTATEEASNFAPPGSPAPEICAVQPLPQPERVRFYDPPFSAPTDLPKDFDPVGYLTLNPDVSAANADPVLHFFRYGWYEGRRWIQWAVDDAGIQA